MAVIHAHSEPVFALRIVFSICLVLVLVSGVYIFRIRKRLFDHDPEMVADHWAARNLRLWQVILVWLLAVDLFGYDALAALGAWEARGSGEFRWGQRALQRPWESNEATATLRPHEAATVTCAVSAHSPRPLHHPRPRLVFGRRKATVAGKFLCSMWEPTLPVPDPRALIDSLAVFTVFANL